MKRIPWIAMLLGAALLTTGCSDPEADKPATDGDAAQQAVEPETSQTPDVPVVSRPPVPPPDPDDDRPLPPPQSSEPTADGPAGSKAGNALFQALWKGMADNSESDAPEPGETSEAPLFQP